MKSGERVPFEINSDFAAEDIILAIEPNDFPLSLCSPIVGPIKDFILSRNLLEKSLAKVSPYFTLLEFKVPRRDLSKSGKVTGLSGVALGFFVREALGAFGGSAAFGALASFAL